MLTRDEYLVAKRAIENPDHIRALMRNVSSQLGPLFAYNPFQHPQHAAVAVVCEAKYILADLLKDFEEIDQYEADKKEELTNG